MKKPNLAVAGSRRVGRRRPAAVPPLAIFAPSLSLFAIGTTEFLIVGLLPILAGSLHVSLSTIGLVVTAYAIGIAVGGPS